MFISHHRQRATRQASPRKHNTYRLSCERLEDRTLPATFTVLNLNDSGAGSLRQAILDANATAGADVISFDVAGTIQLTTGPLPTVSRRVDIDGRTAPGFATTPVVEVDYNGLGGLRFNANSAGSALRSLGHVNAADIGVTLNGGNMTLTGNFIGLRLDGVTPAGNGGNGLEIRSGSANNFVGGTIAQDRNVVSGNFGHGIAIKGSSGTQVVANFIGTDVSGNLDRGNGRNGVLLTDGASGNTIGGTSPSGSQYDGKPPDGNVISGNEGNGVLITEGSKSNTLAGNFIGTDLAGTTAVGNALDGVAIVNGSNKNSLLGTFDGMVPFIFYNVASGNLGNGLRVHDANKTVIQANFFGLGADNDTAVPNLGNGVVIEGSSKNTTFGGVIPLGNVATANGQNGVVVSDTASGFVAFNTFAGVAAFNENPNLGNTLDGFLITSTGGNNLIRTNVISSNLDDGIEVSGQAQGVQIVQNIIGLNTAGNTGMGNTDNGVEIAGNAHDIVIGGPQPTFSIIPQNAISGNSGHGVAVLNNAHDIQVNFSYIGLDLFGTATIGNSLSGVYLGPGSGSTKIGTKDAGLPTVISGNTSHGIEMVGSDGNKVIATYIGTDPTGVEDFGNFSDGVFLSSSFNNQIGGTSNDKANLIAFNDDNGVGVASGNGNAIQRNSIHTNGLLGIDLGPVANHNQVAPVLTLVVTQPGGIQVSGTLVSTPQTAFTIEFFADFVCDPSGFGEGRFFLGSLSVMTDSAGFAAFTFNGPLPPDGADFITATATDADGNTSEFSQCGMLPG